jgi:hypothetical protein
MDSMATKQEIIDGTEFMVREAKRIAGRFSDGDWAMPGDPGGWKAREVFCHVAGIGGVASGLFEAISKAPQGVNAGAGVDVAAMNAGLVQQRAEVDMKEVVKELEGSYKGFTDWVKNQPDDFFEQRRTVGGYTDFTLGELIMQMIVLHSIQHIYLSASRFP